MKNQIRTNCWVLTGHVQGVGFRPFVYRLAHGLGLAGWVQNQKGRVIILAQGTPKQLADFQTALVTDCPPLARSRIQWTRTQWATETKSIACTGFSIRRSRDTQKAEIYVPPDFSICDACLAELANPSDRRYRYPFINCTQCGPRYTLIQRLPYDRANTSMATFPLCDRCLAEYEDPLDRRFHAQPLACPDCGPGLRFYASGFDPAETGHEPGGERSDALGACIDHLRRGEVVAIKGIGGYHLFCDASNDNAILRLRARKPRPHKPLAVLFPLTGPDGLDAVRCELDLGPVEATRLLSPERPVVLIPKITDAPLDNPQQTGLTPEVNRRTLACAALAPNLGEIGAMLPYSPLHHLLLGDYGAPLVATSANRSGEPVATDLASARESLGGVAQGILDHDRPIVRPADDSVFRRILGKARPIRLGRGTAPVEMRLPFSLKRPVLSVGGQMKNTVALAFGDRVVISPHIGDMGSPRGLSVFQRVAADLQTLYGVEAQIIVCDAHPGYSTSRWADNHSPTFAGVMDITKVYHHHAHASALSGEFPHTESRLVFTWDGVGYGPDGTLWGGEALLGKPGAWRRAGSLRPFHLPGGERAGREPWRSAAALCWALGKDWPACPEQTGLLRSAWEKRINAPQTTAMGRLFDAAAALTGICLHGSYEGQGPMELESAAHGCCARQQSNMPVSPLPVEKDNQGCWRMDWAPLVLFLLSSEEDVGYKAAVFHASLARALLTQALRIRAEHDVNEIGLVGGVFQNRLLTEQAAELLTENGFTVILPEKVPGNDGGLSFGQIIEAGTALAGNEAII